MTSDRHVRRSGNDYGEAFLKLLPQGRAWPRNSNSVLGKTVYGLSQLMGYVDGRAADLLETETDPRLANELLLEWEAAFGLPDECIPVPPATAAARRLALVGKMTLLGAQSREFFLAQATLLGETVAIREYAPYMCGVSRVGDTRVLATTDVAADPYFRWQLGPPEMRMQWVVTVEHVLTGVECTFRRYKPAHTELIFHYGTTLDRVMSTYVYLGF